MATSRNGRAQKGWEYSTLTMDSVASREWASPCVPTKSEMACRSATTRASPTSLMISSRRPMEWTKTPGTRSKASSIAPGGPSNRTTRRQKRSAAPGASSSPGSSIREPPSRVRASTTARSVSSAREASANLALTTIRSSGGGGP